MKQIKLTQGQFALVDDTDYDWLSQWKWYAANWRGHFYAIRKSFSEDGKQYSIYMSRQILGLEKGDLRQADHQNHNTLNNRRANLRICTHRENMRNRKSARNSSSHFKGVCWCKKEKKWQAQMGVNGTSKYLGQFNNSKSAALAYDRAAANEFGEFACLNF